MSAIKPKNTNEELVKLIATSGAVITASHVTGKALAVCPSVDGVVTRSRKLADAFQKYSAASIELSEAINEYVGKQS